MKKFNVVLLAFVLFTFTYGCSQQSVRQDDGRDGFVYVHDVIPDVVLDVRYHSNDNFMGTVVDGYHRDVILISKPAAAALSRVQEDLRRQGFGLKIFDGYRPQKAVNHFVRWSENPADRLTKQTYYPDLPKDRLFELGYIARKSGHTRGSTLDLTVVNLASGDELDMGSPWDFFGEVSHHDSPLVDSTATANRELLRQAMVRHGFLPYANEWWHYTLANEPYPDTYFDFNVE